MVGLTVFAATGLVGAAGAMAPVPTMPAAASVVEACALAFGAAPSGAPSSDGLVARGQPLSVDVTWGTRWKRGQTVDVVGCTAVDGVWSETLSVRSEAAERDGVFVHDFRVPSDAADGTQVCQQAIVIGQSPAGAPKAERLEPSCFTVSGDATMNRCSAAEGSGHVGASTGEAETSGGGASRSGAALGPASPRSRASHPAHDRQGESAVTGSATAGLARTGPASKNLLLAASLLLLLGGWSVATGRPVRPLGTLTGHRTGPG